MATLIPRKNTNENVLIFILVFITAISMALNFPIVQPKKPSLMKKLHTYLSNSNKPKKETVVHLEGNSWQWIKLWFWKKGVVRKRTTFSYSTAGHFLLI